MSTTRPRITPLWRGTDVGSERACLLDILRAGLWETARSPTSTSLLLCHESLRPQIDQFMSSSSTTTFHDCQDSSVSSSSSSYNVEQQKKKEEEEVSRPVFVDPDRFFIKYISSLGPIAVGKNSLPSATAAAAASNYNQNHHHHPHHYPGSMNTPLSSSTHSSSPSSPRQFVDACKVAASLHCLQGYSTQQQQQQQQHNMHSSPSIFSAPPPPSWIGVLGVDIPPLPLPSSSAEWGSSLPSPTPTFDVAHLSRFLALINGVPGIDHVMLGFCHITDPVLGSGGGGGGGATIGKGGNNNSIGTSGTPAAAAALYTSLNNLFARSAW